MQKEIYERPDMEVIMMDYEAVITVSNPTPGKGETPIV